MNNEAGSKDRFRKTHAQLTRMRRIWNGLLIGFLTAIVLLVIGNNVFDDLIRKGWYTFSTGSVYARTIAIDDKGRVWAGTGPELRMLDTGGTWRSFTSANSDLSEGWVNALAVDGQGRIWVGASEGLYAIDPDGVWTDYTPTTDKLWIGALAIDSENNVWIGGGDLRMLSPAGSWKVITQRKVNTLAIDDLGQVWAGMDRGLMIVPPDVDNKIYHPADSKLESAKITALATDEAGHVWVGTDNGLTVLSHDGNLVAHFPENPELIGEEIDSLAIDREGNVWVGTQGQLSVYSSDGRWATYTNKYSPLWIAGIVYSLAVDDGNVWMGTYPGLIKFNHHEASNYWIIRALDRILSVLQFLCGFDGIALAILAVVIFARGRQKAVDGLVPSPLEMGVKEQVDKSDIDLLAQEQMDPHWAYEQGQLLLEQGKDEEAIAVFKIVFREGSDDLRRQALEELKKLGEIKEF